MSRGASAKEVLKLPRSASNWLSPWDVVEYRCGWKEFMTMKSQMVRHQFLIEKSFNILGCIFITIGKSQESLEGRMQRAKKAWWRDAEIHKSKDVSWRIKCQKTGGTRPQRFLRWMRKLTME